MNKTFRLAAATMAIALTACTQNEVLQDASSGNPIGFGTYAGQSTKAGASYVKNTQFANDSEFGVMAYKTTGNWANTASPNFMCNQKVKIEGGACTYKPMRYWPLSSKISFLAYYPYVDGSSGSSSSTGLVIKKSADTEYTENSTGLPIATFTVKDEVNKQVDFMYTVLNDAKDCSKEVNGAKPIELKFKHALTRVKFQAKLNGDYSSTADYIYPELAITKIELKGVKNSSTFTFGETEDECKWSDSPQGDASYTFDHSSKGIPLPPNGDKAEIAGFEDGEVLLMIPQEFTDASTSIVVHYTQDGDQAPEVTLALTGTTAWEKNKSMLYTLILDPTKASSPITFTATAGVWDGNNTTVELPTKMTASEFVNAVNAGKYLPAVDITDESVSGTDWNNLKLYLQNYRKYGRNLDLDLTMSKLTGDLPSNCLNSCTALKSFSAPKMKGSIGVSAFEGCTDLESFSAPNMTGSIGGYAFRSCAALKSFYAPNVTGSIGEVAFDACAALKSVYAPKVTGIMSNAFCRCTSLKSIYTPNVTGDIGSGAFYDCAALTEIYLPNMTGGIGAKAFGGCSDLKKITFGAIGSGNIIATNAFSEGTSPNFTAGVCDLFFNGKPGISGIDYVNKNWNYIGIFNSITVIE